MAPSPAENPKTFISYAREDAEFALKLAAGINTWIDQSEIVSGVGIPPLVGSVNGTCGRSNLMTTRVTSPGFILTVSFQPRSFKSGKRAGPRNTTLGYCDGSNACRLMIWTFTRWK